MIEIGDSDGEMVTEEIQEQVQHNKKITIKTGS
jgi:hypothetical protein